MLLDHAAGVGRRDGVAPGVEFVHLAAVQPIQFQLRQQPRQLGNWGELGSACAGINRHVVGDERALQERRSDSILTSSLASAAAR